MQALHEALDACNASRDGAQDAQPALDAAVKAIEKCCTQNDADQAQTLLQALHDRLLPHGTAAAEPDAVQPMQQSTERTKNALLDSVMTEALEPLASLANLGPASAALSAALVARYARCAPREAGIMLLAALGRHVGLPQRPWEAEDGVVLAALPEAIAAVSCRHRLHLLDDALGVVLDEAQSALASTQSAGLLMVAAANGGAPATAAAAGAHAMQPAASNYDDIAACLGRFTTEVAAVAAGLADPAEADAFRCRLAYFAVRILGTCLLASTARASRNVGFSGTKALLPSLQQLLQPQVLAEVAAGQLSALPAASAAAACKLLVEQAADTEETSSIGAALAVWTMYCTPEGRQLQRPIGANAQLSLALTAAEALLTAAAKAHSEACGLAALSLLSAAAAAAVRPGVAFATSASAVDNSAIDSSQPCGSTGSTSGGGSALEEQVLQLVQQLVGTMVGHPAAAIRNSAFHALEDLLLALDPDTRLSATLQLLGCPVPSVAALLLHTLKEHFAARWPPDAVALAAVLQSLPGAHRQGAALLPLGDAISPAALTAFVEACEPMGAAVNLIGYMLLRATPADRLPQALDAACGGSFKANVLEPLQRCAQRCFQLLTSQEADSLQNSALPFAAGNHENIAAAGDVDAMLSVSRLLQTVEWTLQMLAG